MSLRQGGARASMQTVLQCGSEEEQQCCQGHKPKPSMGFRAGLLLAAVLLVSRGGLCSATQNWLDVTNGETLNQEPAEQTTTRSARTHETERTHPTHAPNTYLLKSVQLVNPAVGRKTPIPQQLDTLESLRASERSELTPDQLELRETVVAQDLNSTAAQKSKVVVASERRGPLAADSVAVHCGEGEVTVWVKQNFLGNGQFIRPSDLTLGHCAVLDVTGSVLQFRARLQDCGSTLEMTDDALVYTFPLTYSPTPIGNTFILKTNPAEVVIECHYQRRRYVSSGAARPTWKPFAAGTLAEQQLNFSLRLVAEDWQSQRPSSVYLLGDMMRVEASVLQGHHGVLRVYVDSCVATASPSPASAPRYAFINNHGCLTDARLTGAKSFFMHRSHEDKLHFQLKAFKFHQDPRNSLYITCRLKATTLSVPVGPQNKACSFLTEANRWVASGGDNEVCSCCETSCGEQRRRRSFGPDVDLAWEGMAALGPISLEEKVLQITELPPDPVSLLQTHVEIQDAWRPSLALLCGVGAVLAVVVMVLVHTRLCKLGGHIVHT